MEYLVRHYVNVTVVATRRSCRPMSVALRERCISSGGFTNAAAAAICIFARESSETFTIVNVRFSVTHSRCECSTRDHLFQVLSALSNPTSGTISNRCSRPNLDITDER